VAVGFGLCFCARACPENSSFLARGSR